MNDILEKEVFKFTNFVKAFGPGVIFTILGIFMRSFTERSKIDSLRKNLLGTIRFKMAHDVANILPEKNEEMKHDDYVEICANKLNEYFSANSDLIRDFMKSEKVYKLYVLFFKIFKYGIVVIPLIVIAFGAILLIWAHDALTLRNCCFGVILFLLFIFILWLLKERKNDLYTDMCSRYEVAE